MGKRGTKFDAEFAATVLADTAFTYRGRTIESVLRQHNVKRATRDNWRKRLAWDAEFRALYETKLNEIKQAAQSTQPVVEFHIPEPPKPVPTYVAAAKVRPGMIGVLEACQEWVTNNLPTLSGELPESYTAVAEVMTVATNYLQTERALEIADELARASQNAGENPASEGSELRSETAHKAIA